MILKAIALFVGLPYIRGKATDGSLLKKIDNDKRRYYFINIENQGAMLSVFDRVNQIITGRDDPGSFLPPACADF
jgi:hypothetical protein